MPIQAVIFDMDGVLVDSEACWFRAAVNFVSESGKTWTENDHHACMGNAPEEWARYMREHMKLQLSLEDIVAKVTKNVQAQYQQHLPLLPGTIQALHAAASAYGVALASGSPVELIDQVMNLTGLNKVSRTIDCRRCRHLLLITFAAGCHIVTMPEKILHGMLGHPLTDLGSRKFMEDWRTVPCPS